MKPSDITKVVWVTPAADFVRALDGVWGKKREKNAKLQMNKVPGNYCFSHGTQC